MNDKIKYLVILIIFFIIISCKKSKNAEIASKENLKITDTLKPYPYLPVFPGSYWKYIDSDGKTIKDSIGPYKKDSYSVYQSLSNNREPIFHSDTFYVPFYKGAYVWGYYYRAQLTLLGSPIGPPFVAIVSDSIPVGSLWHTDSGTHNGTFDRIGAKDTLIYINGKTYYPTIVVEHGYWRESSPNYSYEIMAKSFYTKGIGLVKYAYSYPYSTYQYEIVDYFINKR